MDGTLLWNKYEFTRRQVPKAEHRLFAQGPDVDSLSKHYNFDSSEHERIIAVIKERILASSFHIRMGDSNDCKGILACLESAFAPYREQYTPQAYADTVLDAETIQQRLREMRVFVAVSEAEIVGTIGCGAQGAVGHLRGMAVLPEWQGTSVAAALLQAAESELEKNGCGSLTLDTTSPLTRAIRFHEMHGFSPSGRISDFFGMQLYEYSKSLGTASV